RRAPRSTSASRPAAVRGRAASPPWVAGAASPWRRRSITSVGFTSGADAGGRGAVESRSVATRTQRTRRGSRAPAPRRIRDPDELPVKRLQLAPGGRVRGGGAVVSGGLAGVEGVEIGRGRVGRGRRQRVAPHRR